MASRRKLFNNVILGILAAGALVFVLLLAGVGSSLVTR
jgi:hypothetical protein